MDALRLLAPLGAILWLIPVLWPDGTQSAAPPLPMSKALFYVFGVWLLLIALSALLAHLLKRGDVGGGEDDAAGEQET
jgi:hypothetical protein